MFDLIFIVDHQQVAPVGQPAEGEMVVISLDTVDSQGDHARGEQRRKRGGGSRNRITLDERELEDGRRSANWNWPST